MDIHRKRHGAPLGDIGVTTRQQGIRSSYDRNARIDERIAGAEDGLDRHDDLAPR